MMGCVATDYDTFAEAYAAENETSLQNAYYTLPAVLDMAGEVAGRRVLDAGCGSGPLAAALREHAMTGAFTAAGFRTAVVSEPPFAPEARDLFPDELAGFPSGAFLGFLFFVLEAA